MRRYLPIFLVLIALSTSAQNTGINKFEKYYPHTGDWGITFNATPLFDFIGNVVRIGSNNDFASPLRLEFSSSILHMLSNNKARIYSLDIGGKHQTELSAVKFYINGQEKQMYDKYSMDYYHINLGTGIQWRKSSGRFQLYWGYIFSVNYDFGPMVRGDYAYSIDTVMTSTPVEIGSYTLYNSGDGYILSVTDGRPTYKGQRMLVDKSGDNLALGLKAIVGFDFFILPKIAMGATVNTYINTGYTLPGYIKYEYFDFNFTPEYHIEKISKPGQLNINLGSDLSSAFYIRIFL